MTSDVQDIEICTQDNSFIIQCIFITGATVNGCGYVLEGAINTLGYIPRNSKKEIQVNVSNYNSVIINDASSQTANSNSESVIRKNLTNVANCLSTDSTEGYASTSKGYAPTSKGYSPTRGGFSDRISIGLSSIIIYSS